MTIWSTFISSNKIKNDTEQYISDEIRFYLESIFLNQQPILSENIANRLIENSILTYGTKKIGLVTDIKLRFEQIINESIKHFFDGNIEIEKIDIFEEIDKIYFKIYLKCQLNNQIANMSLQSELGINHFVEKSLKSELYG